MIGISIIAGAAAGVAARAVGGNATKITSVKSHQLYTDTFKQPGALLSELTSNINALASYTVETHAGTTVEARPNTKRVLEVEVPPNTLSSSTGGDETLRNQWRKEAKQAEDYATTKGVTLIFKATR